MIPAGFAWFLAISNLLLAAVGGAVFGAVLALVLRQRTNLKSFLIDMGATDLIMILAVPVIATYDVHHASLHTSVMMFVAIGLLGPTIHHILLLPALRRGLSARHR